MERKRTIAFVTATRADYGIARWVLQDIVESPYLTLRLIVTGSHLDLSHGRTVDEVLADGFVVNWEVPVELSEDSPVAAARWMAKCLEGFTSALVDLAADVLLIVGDRFEALIAAQAAALARVPVAHIHGGEVTQGSLDDGMRHAITKLSHVHFAASPEYGRRIVQLGENPASVHVVGSPGLCAIDLDDTVSDDELAGALGFSPHEPFALVTYHPATSEQTADSLSGASAMVEALERFPELRVVITGVNVDPGFSRHREVLTQFADRNPGRVTLIESLGHRRYLAALRRASVCIGNSSSGIIEAPALGVPTVNIGSRQAGRLRAPSVIDAMPYCDSVSRALERALSTNFVEAPAQDPPPYGSGGASKRIVRILTDMDLDGMGVKVFRDCGAGCDSWGVVTGASARE